MSPPPLSANAWLRWSCVGRLLPPDARDVLELGCGQGGFAVRLATRYPAYVGVEPDAAAAEVARGRLAGAGLATALVTGSLATLAAGRSFDLVCAFEVLEHLADDRTALDDWISRLRPGGSVVVSVPAFTHRFAAADELVGHWRRYDPSDLAELLRGAGLREVEVRQYGGVLGYGLETTRNHLARRRLRRDEGSRAERTASSGRWLQPRSRVQALLSRAATAPFRSLERVVPGHGPGLVATGRRP